MNWGRRPHLIGESRGRTRRLRMSCGALRRAQPICLVGMVHVWRASLDVSEDRLRDLACTLAPDELDRAGRLRFARDRRRFIAARGMLRVLLSRYLDVRSTHALLPLWPVGQALSFLRSIRERPWAAPSGPESLL